MTPTNLSTKLYRVPTDTPEKLFVSARPRGGEWLEGELSAWKWPGGVGIVVSLLEPSEQSELDLTAEGSAAEELGLVFLSFPIPDRGVPSYRDRPPDLIVRLAEELQRGKSIVIHCRQGVGRAGMIAASVLTTLGIEREDAIREVSKARGVPIPETQEQRDGIPPAFAHHR